MTNAQITRQYVGLFAVIMFAALVGAAIFAAVQVPYGLESHDWRGLPDFVLAGAAIGIVMLWLVTRRERERRFRLAIALMTKDNAILADLPFKTTGVPYTYRPTVTIQTTASA